jgi:uncharacterized protein YbjQ (UPF0145 family)
MRILISGLLAVATMSTLVGAAYARNDRTVLPLAGVLRTSSGAQDRVDTQIPVQFGGSIGGGSVVSGTGKVGLGGSSPKDACDRALRTAVSNMQLRAIALGATAIRGVATVHGRTESASGSEYLCGVGNVQTSVIVRGVAVGGRGR